MSVLLWSYSGWDNLGAFAAEVENPGKNYPLAMALPVLSSFALLPDASLWTDDAFYVAALQVGPWLGVWVTIAAAVANSGQLAAGMTANSRILWASGRQMSGYQMRRRVAPRFLGQSSRRRQQPFARSACSWECAAS